MSVGALAFGRQEGTLVRNNTRPELSGYPGAQWIALQESETGHCAKDSGAEALLLQPPSFCRYGCVTKLCGS